MTREEAIQLAGRSIACILGATALLEATELPWHFVSLHYYRQLAPASADAAYFASLDEVQLAFCFARIAVLVLLALLFWKCGPRLARLLLPAPGTASPAAAEGAGKSGSSSRVEEKLAGRLIGPRFRRARAAAEQESGESR
jgi:hypothetical protein